MSLQIGLHLVFLFDSQIIADLSVEVSPFPPLCPVHLPDKIRTWTLDHADIWLIVHGSVLVYQCETPENVSL